MKVGWLHDVHPSVFFPKQQFFCPIKKKRKKTQQTAVVTCAVRNYFPPTLIDALHWWLVYSTLFRDVLKSLLRLAQSWRSSFRCHIVTRLISHRDPSSRWSGKKHCASLWRGDLWDCLTSDVSRSAEWGVYGVDTIGGKINGVFASVCVYWRWGCCCRRI